MVSFALCSNEMLGSVVTNIRQLFTLN